MKHAGQRRKASVSQILIRMRSILRKGWVQGDYAKSKSGRMVDYRSEAAVGYCITGARIKAITDLDCEDVTLVKRLIKSCVPGGFSPEAFNDAKATKKSDVIAVVTCAIEKAARRKEGKQ